jgi:hypothetical protein
MLQVFPYELDREYNSDPNLFETDRANRCFVLGNVQKFNSSKARNMKMDVGLAKGLTDKVEVGTDKHTMWNLVAK